MILEIVIEGEFFEIDRRFNLGFLLKNEAGEVILISYSTDMPEENWLNFRKGYSKIKTLINTNNLNEGKYYIYLLGSIHCDKMLFIEEDNIKLEFEIIGNRGKSPYWINKRNSVLAPFIEWKINT